jgi:hypothetical protein
VSFWVIDPGTKLPSVSLTILVVSLTAVIVAGSLHMAGVVQSTSLFSEVFYSSVALYFGRRFSMNGKTFSSEKAEEIKEKVSDV